MGRFGANKYIVLFLLILSLWTFNSKISAQENLMLFTSKVTLSAQNMPVRSILDKIETDLNITFSYKAGIINEKELKSISVKSMPLYDVLNLVFKTDSLDYYPIKNQVVIYKPSGANRTRTVVVRDTVTVTRRLVRTDTVQVKVLVRDTIIRVERDTIRDTIVVAIEKKIRDTISTSSATFKWQLSYEQSFGYGDVSLSNPAWRNNMTRLQSGEESPNQFRVMALTQIGLNEKFFMKTGIGFGRRSWNADYDFKTLVTDSAKIVDYGITVVPSIFKKDSIYIYFPGSDTIWFYDYDTVFNTTVNPLYQTTLEEHKYKGKNSYYFVTIPIYVGWEFPLNQRDELFVEAGILVDFIVSRTGKSLSSSPYSSLLLLSDLPFAPVGAFGSFAVGYTRWVNNGFGWFLRLNSDFRFTPEFSSGYPVRARRNFIGIGGGIKF